MANYRNRKLLDLAHRVMECQFRLAPCRGYAPDGCEPAHSNHYLHGHGRGLKSHDDQHVAACPWCHRYYDDHRLPREWELPIFNEARKRTFDIYNRNGWLEEVRYKPKGE